MSLSQSNGLPGYINPTNLYIHITNRNHSPDCTNGSKTDNLSVELQILIAYESSPNPDLLLSNLFGNLSVGKPKVANGKGIGKSPNHIPNQLNSKYSVFIRIHIRVSLPSLILTTSSVRINLPTSKYRPLSAVAAI
jgi:hypothetical protein